MHGLIWDFHLVKPVTDSFPPTIGPNARSRHLMTYFSIVARTSRTRFSPIGYSVHDLISLPSIYRLVLILANEWFDYFELWQDGDFNPTRDDDKKLLKIYTEGYILWDKGLVQEVDVDRKGRRGWEIARYDNDKTEAE